MTVFSYTLGCKLNQTETEALTGACLGAGMTLARQDERADLVIVNSCTVTARSDAKARHMLRFLSTRHPRALVILTGCYAEVEYEWLREGLALETGAVVVPQSRKEILLEFAAVAVAEGSFPIFSRSEKRAFFENFEQTMSERPTDTFALVSERFHFHTRAFLKIQDGCDGVCAYCRVPLARGRARSLEFPRVMEKLERIVGAGFAEIVLTGVNISAYRSGEHDLAFLLEQAVRRTRHVRFRLSSLEPEALTSRLLDITAEEAICPHIHIPIQSGSNAVLARMQRRYTALVLTEGAARLKKRKPDIFLAGDVIVGFPGETDADCLETERLAEESGFAFLHVFPFSSRPGTTAAAFSDRVPAGVLKSRVRRLLDLGSRLTERYLENWSGKIVDVLLEKKTGPAAWTGSSAHSVKCRVEHVPEPLQRPGVRVWAEIVATGKVCGAEFRGAGDGPPVFRAQAENDQRTH
jgi:threonylcarbamoyladenosine tRNA methylthiotransferase MtaB